MIRFKGAGTSSLRHQILDLRGLDVSRGILPNGQGLEVSLATLDLRAFLLANVFCEETPLCLDHKVEALSAVFLDQHGPIGVVGTQWGVYLEPTRELGVNLDSLVLL